MLQLPQQSAPANRTVSARWGSPALPFGASRSIAGGACHAPHGARPRINFIDTADSYGPFVSEDLIRERCTLLGLIIATKGALKRHGPGLWKVVGQPEYLRRCVMMSLRRPKVDRIDLWQLHRIDPAVPRDEQFGVMAAMQKEGSVGRQRPRRDRSPSSVVTACRHLLPKAGEGLPCIEVNPV